MRLKIFPWLGQEFVSLSWEGSGNGTAEDETRELLTGFAGHLRRLGLSLNDVVRTRMFARDMDASPAETVSASGGRSRVIMSLDLALSILFPRPHSHLFINHRRFRPRQILQQRFRGLG